LGQRIYGFACRECGSGDEEKQKQGLFDLHDHSPLGSENDGGRLSVAFDFFVSMIHVHLPDEETGVGG